VTPSKVTWLPGIVHLLDEAQTDVDELLAGRRVSRAQIFSKETGLELTEDFLQMF
jgi:hypothetical protein